MGYFSGTFFHGSGDKTFQKNPFNELAVCGVKLQECCPRFSSLTCSTSPDAHQCAHSQEELQRELLQSQLVRESPDFSAMLCHQSAGVSIVSSLTAGNRVTLSEMFRAYY